MPRLVIHDSNGSSRVFELLGDRPISIGRAKSSNLVLDDPSVSRLHAVVRSTPDGHWQIIDRGSSNGVKINGSAAKEAMLRPNDEILVGLPGKAAAQAPPGIIIGNAGCPGQHRKGRVRMPKCQTVMSE